MKIDRLMAIVIYLLNHGRTSTKKLATEFEVSPRTIMRDLEALDRAGIPIQSVCGVDGGFSIMDTYVMDRQLTTKNDYEVIVAALKGLSSAYSNTELKQTLEKIQTLAPEVAGAIRVDFSVASEKPEINDQIKILQDAIKRKHVVQFLYTNSRDEKKQMEVEPVLVEYKWYNWYLIAYHEKYKDYCMFKLIRMENVCISEKVNSKEHDIAKIQLQDQINNSVKIRLFGKASVKSKCREYLNGEITKEYKNGDFEFCFCVPEHETYWFGVVLSLGNQIKILEPDHMIERICKNCSEIMKVYQEDEKNECL